MSLRNVLAGTAVAAGLMMVGAPRADAGPEIPLGSYTGPVSLKFFNYESFISPGGVIGGAPAVGDQNFGIFELTSIQAGINSLWSSPTDGQFLLGVFNGIMVTGITSTGPTDERSTNSGGTFQLYTVPTADGAFLDQGIAGYANAGCAVASLCYHGITDAAGAQLVLTMNLTPGQGAAGDPANTTLVANIDVTQAVPTGSAASFATIIGDPQFGSIAHLQDNFCPNSPVSIGCAPSDGSTFALASSDPITGTVVPEPASMAIIGTGLLALGAARSRRQKKTDLR